MKIVQRPRGSGRTYAMLQDAIQAAIEGKSVSVVAASIRHGDNLMVQIQSMLDPMISDCVTRHGREFKLGNGRINIVTPQDVKWETDSTAKPYWDHFAVETILTEQALRDYIKYALQIDKESSGDE